MTYPRPRHNVTEADFTSAQLTVLHLTAHGLPDKVIAARLNRSYHTIRDHQRVLLARTGFHSRTALAVWWALHQHGVET